MSRIPESADESPADDIGRTGDRGKAPWVPTGEGISLDARLRGGRQLALTALLILAVSAAGGFSALGHSHPPTPASFFVVFAIAAASMVVIWAIALGLRTLRLRRLIQQFPGTLVFSFTRTDDVNSALHALGVISEKFSFNELGVQVVGDLHGMTFWQGRPARMYGALPWSSVQSTSVDRETYPLSRGLRATTLRIEAVTLGRVVRFSLFGVDASILPFPSRGNVEWVHTQIAHLRSQAGTVNFAGSQR